ncbi:MAG: hypothetical protein HC804_01295 [Anaerolineae bacterium]|nr:hypothetical protein [Anaerolineae bacterium]
MNRTQANETETRIPDRWLAPLRILWIACAILLLAIYFGGIQPQYNEMRQICFTPECRVLTINPEEFQIIQRVG